MFEADFLLEPDALEPERPARSRPVRLVSTGLAPTVEPPQRRTKEPAPCYRPCPHCRCLVLVGETPAGTVLVVEPHTRTYVPVWPTGAARPTLHESRGYPVHGCVGGAAHE